MENSDKKVVMISGANRGIGSAIAEKLLSEHYLLSLGIRNPEHLPESLASVRETQLLCHKYDARDGDSAKSWVDATVKQFGSLDVLINNAGITRDALLVKFKNGKVVSKMSLKKWQTVVDVNLTGVFLCGGEAARHMIELGNEGVIINISSISRAGNMGQTNYSATKAGVQAMAVVWGKELARYGIRAAFIAPGFINTEMVAAMKSEARDKLTAAIPLKRIGEPDEVAQAAEFIFKNDYFTGRGIDLDGALRL